MCFFRSGDHQLLLWSVCFLCSPETRGFLTALKSKAQAQLVKHQYKSYSTMSAFRGKVGDLPMVVEQKNFKVWTKRVLQLGKCKRSWTYYFRCSHTKEEPGSYCPCFQYQTACFTAASPSPGARRWGFAAGASAVKSLVCLEVCSRWTVSHFAVGASIRKNQNFQRIRSNIIGKLKDVFKRRTVWMLLFLYGINVHGT